MKYNQTAAHYISPSIFGSDTELSLNSCKQQFSLIKEEEASEIENNGYGCISKLGIKGSVNCEHKKINE